jgi:tripartite-type tricarboxylate transporter receptor subunit TctC
MFFAPSKTPTATIDKLNASIRSALEAPAVASIMQRDGYIPDNRNAAETATFFSKEVDLMADAVAAAGIKPN